MTRMKHSPSTPRQKLIVVAHLTIGGTLTEISVMLISVKETSIQREKHANSSNSTLVLAQYQAQNKHLRKEENMDLSLH